MIAFHILLVLNQLKCSLNLKKEIFILYINNSIITHYDFLNYLLQSILYFGSVWIRIYNIDHIRYWLIVLKFYYLVLNKQQKWVQLLWIGNVKG